MHARSTPDLVGFSLPIAHSLLGRLEEVISALGIDPGRITELTGTNRSERETSFSLSLKYAKETVVPDQGFTPPLEGQLGSKTWPFCGDFGDLIGVRATESMGLRE